MDAAKQLIIIHGKDATDAIVSCQFCGAKCDIVYDSSPRVYHYNSSNVRIIELRQTIDPQTVVFKFKGATIADIDEIRDFGEFYAFL